MLLRASKRAAFRPSIRPWVLQTALRARCGTRHLASACALALLAVAGAGSALASNNSVPPWVKDAMAKPVPVLPESTKAVVLLEDTTFTVGSDGRAVEHVRRVVKILRPQGRTYGEPEVWFDKDQKLLSMKVWSVDPAGHEFAMKDSDLSEYSPPGSGEMYGDDKARMAEPPGRDPGGVVAWEYELRERPYIAETSWEFQGRLPRVAQSFTLVLPEGFTYVTTWAHHAVKEGADLENHHYRWEMNNQEGIDLDQTPLSPPEGALAGRMTVHYAGPGLQQPQEGTWKGIGEWYQGLSRDRLMPNPEIAAKAAELTAGKTDFYDKSQAIGEFVQKQVRYFAVELGIGGFQPHPAGEIFRGRYGDCKDKATLLSAMLATVGIHSALVMVDTERGVIDPESPSIHANHVIAAIEVPQGYTSSKLHSLVLAKTGKQYLIFDPTWDLTPFGQLENNLQGSYGVLMEGSDTQVLRLPEMSPDLNTVARTASFHLAADGTLSGSVEEQWFGDLAEDPRAVLTLTDAKRQQNYFDTRLARDFGAVSMSGLKTENASELNKKMTAHFDIEAAHFASFTGPLLMVRPRVLGSFRLHVNTRPRTVSIDLEQTMVGTDEYDIALPEGYVVDELPDPVHMDVGFANYQSSTELRDGKLHYKRTYTQREISVPADKYPQLRKLAAAIANDEDSRAVLKRAASTK